MWYTQVDRVKIATAANAKTNTADKGTIPAKHSTSFP